MDPWPEEPRDTARATQFPDMPIQHLDAAEAGDEATAGVEGEASVEADTHTRRP